MLTAAGAKTCPHCQEFRHGRETVFEVAGVRHTAPAFWFTGRRQALERTGLSPSVAFHEACMEWVRHCAELEAKR